MMMAVNEIENELGQWAGLGGGSQGELSDGALPRPRFPMCNRVEQELGL